MKKKSALSTRSRPRPSGGGSSGARGGRNSAIISRGAEMFSCLDGRPLSLFVPFALLATHRLRLLPPSPPGSGQEVDGA